MMKESTHFIGLIVGGETLSLNARGYQYWKSWLFNLSGALDQRSPVYTNVVSPAATPSPPFAPFTPAAVTWIT